MFRVVGVLDISHSNMGIVVSQCLVNSFLSWSSIPLYEYTPLLITEHVFFFQFCTVINKTAVNNHVQIFVMI